MPTDTATAPIDPATHVADLVTEAPPRAAVFEQLGIEYCCGGKVPLGEAVAEKGLQVDEVIAMLDAATAAAPSEPDLSRVGIPELIANIVDTHHAYLHAELPRVGQLAHKVARAHGAFNPKLVEARDEVDRFVEELAEHLVNEEEDLFPTCLRIAAGEAVDAIEIRLLLTALEDEHEQVGDRLERLRDLLDGFVPPAQACTSYRAYLDTLARLEDDIHRHVHKENHILFGMVRDAVAG